MTEDIPQDFEPIHESSSYPYAWQHISNEFRVVVSKTGTRWNPLIQTADEEKRLYPYKDTPEESKSLAITWMNSVGTK